MGHHHPSTAVPSNIIGVAVLATAVGAVAGLLFAPKSGKETRADLQAKMKDAKHKGMEKADHMRHKMNSKVDTALSKVHDATDSLDEAADKAAAQVKAKADEASRRARAA